MKKPNIRNWTTYWTTTLAVSGMLVLGGCDNNEQQTADNTNQIEATENEATTPPERENVEKNQQALNEEEMDTQNTADQDANTGDQIQYERTSASSDRSASQMKNMDNHLDEHKDVNDTIRETLTENPNANRMGH